MRRATFVVARACALGLAAGLAACGNDDPAGPAPGTLVVGNTVFGSGPADADGFVVTVDGQPQSPRAILNVGQVLSLPPGTHGIGLADLAANCATDTNNGASTGPNPQPASITPGDTVIVWFAVRCD